MKFQRFNKKLSLLLVFLFIFTACQTKTGDETLVADKFVKVQETYYGPFDTDVDFVFYIEESKTSEIESIKKELEESLWHYHKLFDNYENYDFNNIKTINDYAGKEPVEVDPLIIEAIEKSVEFYHEYGPELNIAMGTVLELWHEVREASYDGEKTPPPPTKDLEEAMSHSNIEDIVIDNNTVFLKDPEMKLDLGGIATGFSLEKIIEELKEKGLNSFLLSAGGDVRVVGKPLEEEKEAWKIGIQNPLSMDDENAELLVDVVEVVDSSVLTSGSYQRYFEYEGIRYNHIIDPETLYPATDFDSVTVITESCELADYLSTLLFIKDFEEGKELIESLDDVEALWIFTDQSQYKTWEN